MFVDVLGLATGGEHSIRDIQSPDQPRICPAPDLDSAILGRGDELERVQRVQVEGGNRCRVAGIRTGGKS